jgi:hypothetical protein
VGSNPTPGIAVRVRRARHLTNVRSYSDFAAVRTLLATGLNDCEVARATGVPRSTVREWRIGEPRDTALRPACAVCDGPAHDLEDLPDSYVYLLGLYLGDGCLSEQPRGVLRLRITLDDHYPGIIGECVEAMAGVLPSNRPHVQKNHGAHCVEVGISSKQLRCLFPQHAPGRKHERRIVLAAWQQKLTTKRPDLLVRGLIHSDGCRSMNTVRHGGKAYAYPRYTFSNRSDDIKRIFCDACDLLEIEWRVMNRWNISVARRESVARLEEFAGPKA